MLKKYRSDIINVIFILLGSCIMAFAFGVFLIPNNISPSGFSGLSAIISYFVSKTGIIIPASAIYLTLNIALYIIAYKLLGKRFAIKALIGILAFSLAIEVVDLIGFTIKSDDLLLCAIYGGGIMGLGIGLVLRNDGSTGGSDLMALIIRNKSHVFTTGQIIIATDIFVLALSCVAYGFGPLMYSIITIAISGVITDMVVEGATGVRAYYIFTSKKEEVCTAIYQEIGRGVTEIKAEGMYSHTEKDILLCLINKYRAPRLKSLVSKLDSEAFVFCTPVSEVIGRGFSLPVKKKQDKTISQANPTQSQEILTTQATKPLPSTKNKGTNNQDINNAVQQKATSSKANKKVS